MQSETFAIGGWQTGCLHRSKFAALKVLNPLNYEVDIWGYIDDFESKIVGIMNYQKYSGVNLRSLDYVEKFNQRRFG